MEELMTHEHCHHPLCDVFCCYCRNQEDLQAEMKALPMTDPAVAARKMLDLVIAEWEWDEVRDEFRESLAQAIAAHTEAAVKEERERCAVIAEDYRDSTPFQRLA